MNSSIKHHPQIALIMGSQSDWPTMEKAAQVLDQFEVPYEAEIVSAHRTPDRLAEYAKTAEARGIQIIIAGAGGAAHLPGMTAAYTTLPVLGVPMITKALDGLDSALSILQMPKGIPVGTLAIGESGAINAALLAIAILALTHAELNLKLKNYRQNQTQEVLIHSQLKKI